MRFEAGKWYRLTIAPSGNGVTTTLARERLEAAGFRQVGIQDISATVGGPTFVANVFSPSTFDAGTFAFFAITSAVEILDTNKSPGLGLVLAIGAAIGAVLLFRKYA